MLTQAEYQELKEIRKARAEMQATLKPSERAFLNRKKRFLPDEAEALIYQMPEEVKQAREAYEPPDALSWGNPADIHYVRADGQLRGIDAMLDITKDPSLMPFI